VQTVVTRQQDGVALVTGGGEALGKAIALGPASEAASVVVAGAAGLGPRLVSPEAVYLAGTIHTIHAIDAGPT
jgi:NAD(P)-dependent dehydrogenase (short-subunit alcohol dehydrogenase family)